MTFRYQLIALFIMAVFYAVYIGKMISQKKQGIVTNQIAKDKSDKKRFRIERIMAVATYSIIVVELVSIATGYSLYRYSLKTAGMVIGALGDLCFILAVFTMKDSWRAGVAADEHRKFVSKGIFKISRNPAFLGFDLVYIGILLMFFNWFLLIFTIFAVVMLHLQILQEEKYLAGEFGAEYDGYRKNVCRYLGLKNPIYWVAIFLAVGVIGVYATMNMIDKSSALPDMSFEECIEYTTEGNSDAVITVGIIKDGEMSYKVYGEDGKELEPVLHSYEIGSLTKTITASLINKALMEGKLELGDTIDKYLDLPAGKNYPTIAELLTHTSGYEPHYLNPQMMWNGVIGGSPFRYVYSQTVLKEAGEAELKDEPYEWKYSNFGYALLGLVIESVYDENYVAIVNDYVAELGMNDTAFCREQGDLGKCWTWEIRDAYAPAGAIKSNVMDMLTYASLQLNDEFFAPMHEPLHTVGVKDASYEAMNIHIDEIGMAWILDDTNGYIWHNGATDDYNSYLGFCKETGTAVVILSNLPSGYRIPATVLGIKLLNELQ